MTDWNAVWEHLATVVMGWVHEGFWWRDGDDAQRMLRSLWQPSLHPDQFFMLKDAMKKLGWNWRGWEDESRASVEYWKPRGSRAAYGDDLMQANALAAAEATGYESG